MSSRSKIRFNYFNLKDVVTDLHETIETYKSELNSRIADVENSIDRRTTPYFPMWDASEPSVRAVFHDLVKPMDTVFDVGANIGALSSTLSRIVGPRGMVIAFEASASIARQLNINLAANRYTNVTVFHGAVYKDHGRLLSFHDDGADSKLDENGKEFVETLQLDRVCEMHQLVPSFIKMDIEGAEYDALLGAQRLLANHKPHIVFEQATRDDRVIDLLKPMGYHLFDAATYRPVESSQDYEYIVGSVNNIAIHDDRIGGTAYKTPPRVELIASFDAGKLKIEKTKATLCFHLEPGRHIFEITGKITAETETLYSRVSFLNVVIGQLWTNAAFFIANHRNLPFEAQHAGEYHFEVGEISSDTQFVENITFRIHKVIFE